MNGIKNCVKETYPLFGVVLKFYFLILKTTNCQCLLAINLKDIFLYFKIKAGLTHKLRCLAIVFENKTKLRNRKRQKVVLGHF